MWLEPGGERSDRPSISRAGGKKASKKREKVEDRGDRRKEKTGSVLDLKSVFNTTKETGEEKLEERNNKTTNAGESGKVKPSVRN